MKILIVALILGALFVASIVAPARQPQVQATATTTPNEPGAEATQQAHDFAAGVRYAREQKAQVEMVLQFAGDLEAMDRPDLARAERQMAAEFTAQLRRELARSPAVAAEVPDVVEWLRGQP